MARILQVVAPLLLLLLPAGLRELLSPTMTDHRPPVGAAVDSGTTTGGEVVLHPLVLVPGLTCSDLEARLTDAYRPSMPRCGAMKGKGWFGLWANSSDLPAHHYVPCFIEQMSLVYDPATNDYRNLPGVETRVRGFGSSRGFHWNPNDTAMCLAVLRHELESAGYRDGDTLFAAQYDLRHAPPVPGQSSEVFSRYFRRLTRLIEGASQKNQGRKVILFGHSFGGMVALEFVRSTTMAWRDKYIKHLILVAPVPAEAGFVDTLQLFVSGSELMYVPTVTPLAMTLRPMWRSFESSIVNFPSPAVFGDRPLVVTAQRNYSAYDVEDLLADIGFSAGVEPFRRRSIPKMRYFQAPMVPTTCINGVGNETPEQLIYWDGNFDAHAEIVYGNGDKIISLISMSAFDDKMLQQTEQNKLYKTIKLQGADHSTILEADWALKRVMQEILEANHI